MYARVNTFLGSPKGIEASLADARDNVVPAMQEIDGCKGLMILVDRASGRSIALTFWESAEKLRASEETATHLRHESAASGQEIVLSVERYEVALDTTTRR